jgi:Carboxypeptidase regulatory-like domain
MVQAILSFSACAQDGNGYLGYVVNANDKTVTIFATETATSIGNNDRLLATVPLPSSTAIPQHVAATPDGTYAFVTSPSDGSVWQISVANPATWSSTVTSPPFNVTVLRVLNTQSFVPDGVTITYRNSPDSNGDPGTTFYIWIADPKNCQMRVFDFDSTKPNSFTEDNFSPLSIKLPGNYSKTAVSCPVGGISTVSVATETADALWGTFNGVTATLSGNASSTVDLIAYFDALNLTSAHNGDLNALGVEGVALDPANVGFGFTALTTATIGACGFLMGPVHNFGNEIGIVNVNPGCGVTHPSTIVLPGVSVIIKAATNDSFGNSNFSIYATDTEMQQVWIIPVTISGSTQASFGAPSAVNFGPVATPEDILVTPDQDRSIVYVTEVGPKALELLRINLIGTSPCVVGSSPPNGCSSNIRSSSGGQLYDTSVKVGNQTDNSTSSIAFGPISVQSGAISWFAGYSLTGGLPFIPFPPAPTTTNAKAPTYSFYPPVNTPLSSIRVQAVGMVSNPFFNGIITNTWNGTAGVNSQVGNTNYQCSSAGNNEFDDNCSPSGPSVEAADFFVGAAASAAIGTTNDLSSIHPEAGSGISSGPAVQPGDVTVISFSGNCSESPCDTNSYPAENGPLNLKAQATCTLEVSVNGVLPPVSTPIMVTAGIDQVAGYLNCIGAAGDIIDGMVDWGNNSTKGTLQGLGGGSNYQLSNPTTTSHTYPTINGQPFVIKATAVIDGNNSPVVVSNMVTVTVVNPTYNISGSISGAGGNGATVKLSGVSTTTTTADASGNFTFTGLTNGAYTVAPSKVGYSFNLTSRAVTVSGANPPSVNFSSTLVTYSISGNLAGAGGNGAIVNLSGTSAATTTADGSGNYSFAGLANGSYTITPSKSGYTFTPVNHTVNLSGANLTNINFTSIASSTYTISGTITGSGGNGATVTLGGTSSGTTIADGLGNYSFTGLGNGPFTITPSKTGYTFSPVTQTVTVNGANVVALAFASTPYVNPTYTLSGTVANTGGATLNLSGSSSGTTLTDSAGNYSFSGLANGSYTVAPTLSGYTFTPASQLVTISGTNVKGVNFTGHPPTYSITGTVSGLGAGGTSLSLTGTSSSTTTADVSGIYSFAGLLNGNYTVTPTKPGNVFAPLSKSVVVNNANVAGVNFAAVTLLTCSFNPLNPATVQTGQQVTATLMCQGNPGDTLSGAITDWGDKATSSATTVSVSGSGSATLTFTHTYSAPSPNYFIAASVSDTSNTLPAATPTTTITVKQAPVNPTIIPSASSASVIPGQPTTFKLGFQGNSADAGAVFSISCQGLPPGATCSYSPNPFALDSNGVGTAVLTIATTGQATVAAAYSKNDRSLPVFASVFALPGLVGLLLTGLVSKRSETKRRAHSMFFALVLATILGGISACGTSVSHSPLPCPNCTPAGTSAVLVTATSQNPALQSSVTLQLQVGAVPQ